MSIWFKGLQMERKNCLHRTTEKDSGGLQEQTYRFTYWQYGARLWVSWWS